MVAYTQLKVTSTWDFRACLSVLNLCISYSQEEGKKKKPLRLSANIRNIGRTNEKNWSQGFKIGLLEPR